MNVKIPEFVCFKHLEADKIFPLMAYVYAMVILIPIIQIVFIVSCFFGAAYQIFTVILMKRKIKDGCADVEDKFVEKKS